MKVSEIMKDKRVVIAVGIIAMIGSYWLTADNGPVPDKTNESAKASLPISLMSAGPTNHTDSVHNIPTENSRIPVYIIPRAVVIFAPGQRFVVIKDSQAQDLAQLGFPTVIVTNLTIYNR